MRITSSRFLIISSAASLAACTGGLAPDGPQIEIAVAPINYPGISNVCFDLTVLNGMPTPDDADPDNEPDTVWSKAGICSLDYGNGAGGDITYIGPCDAGVEGNNYVQLTLADVFAGSSTALLDQLDAAPDGDAEYQNPCPTGTPCMLDFECVENADQLVVFNLTIMRDADQGFFDIAVNFEDVFCSAKFDTCYMNDPQDVEDDSYLDLLHDASGKRHHSAVLAVACSGGATASADGPAPDLTHLYMDSIVVTCGTTVIALDPAAGDDGNVYDESTTPALGLATSGTVWQYAVYAGQELLDCGDGEGSCDKVYWNVAIGIEGLPAGCTLSAAATASSGELEHELAPSFFVPGTTPKATTYPVMVFEDIPLTDANGVICGQYALNESAGKVRTDYTAVDVPHDFGFELAQIEGTVVRGSLDGDDTGTSANKYELPIVTLNTATPPEGVLQRITGTVGGPLVGGLAGRNDRVDFYQLTVPDIESAYFAFSCDTSVGVRANRPRVNVYSASGEKLYGPVECGYEGAFARNSKLGEVYYVAVLAPSADLPLDYELGVGVVDIGPQGLWFCSASTGRCVCSNGGTCSGDDVILRF